MDSDTFVFPQEDGSVVECTLNELAAPVAFPQHLQLYAVGPEDIVDDDDASRVGTMRNFWCLTSEGIRAGVKEGDTDEVAHRKIRRKRKALLAKKRKLPHFSEDDDVEEDDERRAQEVKDNGPRRSNHVATAAATDDSQPRYADHHSDVEAEEMLISDEDENEDMELGEVVHKERDA